MKKLIILLTCALPVNTVLAQNESKLVKQCLSLLSIYNAFKLKDTSVVETSRRTDLEGSARFNVNYEDCLKASKGEGIKKAKSDGKQYYKNCRSSSPLIINKQIKELESLTESVHELVAYGKNCKIKKLYEVEYLVPLSQKYNTLENPKEYCRSFSKDINSVAEKVENSAECLPIPNDKDEDGKIEKCELGIDPQNNCPKPDPIIEIDRENIIPRPSPRKQRPRANGA